MLELVCGKEYFQIEAVILLVVTDSAAVVANICGCVFDEQRGSILLQSGTGVSIGTKKQARFPMPVTLLVGVASQAPAASQILFPRLFCLLFSGTLCSSRRRFDNNAPFVVIIKDRLDSYASALVIHPDESLFIELGSYRIFYDCFFLQWRSILCLQGFSKPQHVWRGSVYLDLDESSVATQGKQCKTVDQVFVIEQYLAAYISEGASVILGVEFFLHTHFLQGILYSRLAKNNAFKGNCTLCLVGDLLLWRLFY